MCPSSAFAVGEYGGVSFMPFFPYSLSCISETFHRGSHVYSIPGSDSYSVIPFSLQLPVFAS